MTNEFFEALQQWQQEGRDEDLYADFKGSRSVRIEIGRFADPDFEDVYLYDYKLQCGAIIKSLVELEEIDLKAKKLQELDAQTKMYKYLNN